MSDRASHEPAGDDAQGSSVAEEELVAYLDRELDPESARRVEQRLAADPEARRRLQQLDHTWELLDELELSQLGPAFTRSTLEMVAAAAGTEAAGGRRRWPRARRCLLALAVLLAAGLTGFLAVAWSVPDPNRQLLLDLPVLENLDQYRQVDSVEFLRMLRSERLFLEEQSE